MNLKERSCIIRITEFVAEDGNIPQMLKDLQATPVAVEYDYCRCAFNYCISSPLLFKVEVGMVVPEREVYFDAPNQMYKFKEL